MIHLDIPLTISLTMFLALGVPIFSARPCWLVVLVC